MRRPTSCSRRCSAATGAGSVWCTPTPRRSSGWSRRQGVNGFYDSLEARLECCRVRKVEPFRRAIAGYPAWVTGVRREQSGGRAAGAVVAWDGDTVSTS